jgi:hypothetical protein
LAGFVPGIAETFSLSAGRSRLAGLQGVERAAAPAGVINALYAIRVLRNARLSRRWTGHAKPDRRGQQRADHLDTATRGCGERRRDRSRSHAGNPLHTAERLPQCKKLAMRIRRKCLAVCPQRSLHALGNMNLIGCDSGSRDRVGCFQSQVVGVGPQIGFLFPVGDRQGYLNLKAYGEFAAENPPAGWNAWVTFAISPPAPGAPPTTKPIVRKY